MKPLIFFSCLFFAAVTNAKNYYLSARGNDANNGLTPATSWQTLTKLNAAFVTINTGDSIFFKCGDSFYGSVNPTKSGLVFSSYGTGAKPIITGLTTVSSWTSLGNNIWEAPVPGGLATLNMVVINGLSVPMGRYPNADAPVSGYRIYQSFVTDVSITDTALKGTANWTGADLVIRRNPFSTNRVTITNNNNNTISFAGIPGSEYVSGSGYFIENHLATLDQNGEWFYDPATKKIKIYYNTTPPAIEVSTVTSLVKMVFTGTNIKSNIVFKDITFRGSEGIMMQYTFCNNITINNCDLLFTGETAIFHRYVTGLTIQNSTISDVNMVGIQDFGGTIGSNIIIKNNLFRRIGINPGMISKSTLYQDGASNCGIVCLSQNLIIQENTFDSIGYCGISLRTNKSNQTIRKNIISNFCSVKNDGGAIYNSGLRGGTAVINLMIDSNIIFKSLNASNGTSLPFNEHARGVYLDATSTGVNVLNNTIFDCWEGIYLSQAQSNIIRGNTVYNTGLYQNSPNASNYAGALSISDAFDTYQHTRKNVITKNVFFAKKSNQLLYYQYDRYNGVDSVGIIDSNFYSNPGAQTPILMTNASQVDIYSVSQWQAVHTVYDKHSKGASIAVPQFIINTVIGNNKYPNEFCTSNITGLNASSAGTVHKLTWDNTGQITGAGSAKLTSSVTSRNFTQLYGIVGAIDASKRYVLRFKTKGIKPGSFKAYLLQWTGAYATLTSKQTGSIDTTVQQHEILFAGEHSTQTNVAVFIEFSQDSSVTYIDDLQFYEATTTKTNVDDYIRFEYNATNTPQLISLGSKYIGVDSTVYNGFITLNPFTSAVLMKTGAIETSLKADAGSDINLYLPGNSTPLTGSATSDAISYTWTKVSGPAQYTLANPTKLAAQVSNLVTGRYVFQLKVINSKGDSAISNLNITVAGVLSFALIDFSARNNNDKIALQWKMEAELNVSHYTLERSNNGKDFATIAKVNSNNTFTQGNYTYTDNYLAKEIIYYRLMIVNNDGSRTYSKIITITGTNEISFFVNKLFLSAANKNIALEINSIKAQTINIAVTDVMGRIIFKGTAKMEKGINTIDKTIAGLNKGIFYTKLITEKGVTTEAVLSQ